MGKIFKKGRKTVTTQRVVKHIAEVRKMEVILFEKIDRLGGKIKYK